MEQSDNRTQAILSWQHTTAIDLRVEQDEQFRYLVLNGQRQSQMQLHDPTSPSYPHLLMLLQWLSGKQWHRLLQLGLGGGELSRALAARWPERQVVSVEQEPLIIEAYQQFFQPQPHPNESLVCADAAIFAGDPLAKQQQFEVIFVDIFPWPDNWQQLMQALLQLRANNGWFCINLPRGLHGNWTDDLTGEPLPHWQRFWDEMSVTLQCYPVPGYRNQLWLGA